MMLQHMCVGDTNMALLLGLSLYAVKCIFLVITLDDCDMFFYVMCMFFSGITIFFLGMKVSR